MDKSLLFLNRYLCDHEGNPEHGGISPSADWSNSWNCARNDRCPVCNAEIEPYDFEELEPYNFEELSEENEDEEEDEPQIPEGFSLAGYFGVDAGLCWIGDPCYVIHSVPPPEAIGKDWGEFCGNLNKLTKGKYPTVASFPYDLGHEGLGVCVSTGYGDGVYPVFVKKNSEGRIEEVRVRFI